MSFVTNTIDRAFRAFGYVRAKPEEMVQWEAREGIYTINQLLYDCGPYRTRRNNGALEDILGVFIGPSFCDPNVHRLYPVVMPFKNIVDVYQRVLPGTWGSGIKIAKTVDEKPVNNRILPPLARIWRDSNFDSEKAKAIRWAANFGTVGLRIVSRQPSPSENRQARVTINPDHPSKLYNFEEDGEGNVTAVCLKHTMKINDVEAGGTLEKPVWRDVEVVETLTKEEFSLTYDGEQQIDDEQRQNTLGFCPYVILRHKDNGSAYGDWAYKGAEELVHRINWRISRQDKSIDRHQFPKWFIAAGGAKPETIDMGDTQGSYVQTVKDTPPPVIEAIVAQVDQTAAQEFWMQQREELRNRQPEMNLADVKLLANTSGEALQQILKPTEEVLSNARPGYVHAFTRAMQMALSAGVQIGAWDIGTGTGDGAGDAAYRQGLEDFAFEPMPLLPPTAQQMIAQAQGESAAKKSRMELGKIAKSIGYSDRKVWREAGLSEEEIAEMETELGQQSLLPGEDEGSLSPDDSENA